MGEQSSQSDSFHEPLVEQAQQGDEAAFEALVRKYQSLVYNYALKICRDKEKAEETFQDTFVNVYRKLKQFDGRSRFSTWLYTIVSNNCLMRHRKRKVDALMESFDNLPTDETGPVTIRRSGADPLMNPDNIVINTELGEQLDQAISRLPFEYRTVFVLRDIEGRTSEETAQILGISLEAAKSRLRRARAFLRKELLPYVSG